MKPHLQFLRFRVTSRRDARSVTVGVSSHDGLGAGRVLFIARTKREIAALAVDIGSQYLAVAPRQVTVEAAD